MGKVGFHSISPLPLLFIETDKYIKGWDPIQDSIALASALVNSGQKIVRIKEIDDILGWGPRQINPAIFVLDLHNAIGHSKVLEPVYAYNAVILTPKTKRYAINHK